MPDLDTPLLADALVASGARVDVADWRDPSVDWSNARVTMLRSPWDYVHHLDEFIAWAERVNAVSELVEPARARALEHAQVVPARAAGPRRTDRADRGAPRRLGGVARRDLRRAGLERVVVVKPAIASGGDGARRGEVGDVTLQAHLDALLATADVLVQPYVGGGRARR